MIMLDNTKLWNFRQAILAKIKRTPVNCWCKQCEPGQTYECEGCQRQQPYCRGQDDDFFELCDDCWEALPESTKYPSQEGQP